MSSEPTNKVEFPHYFKKLPDGTTLVDVYHVLRLFEVTDAAIAHAIKKLLCAGKRGTKKQEQDLQEAGKSIARALEILSAEHYDGMSSAAGHHGYASEDGDPGPPGIDYNAVGVSRSAAATAIDLELDSRSGYVSVRVIDKHQALYLMQMIDQYNAHRVVFRWTDHNAIWQELRQLSTKERSASEF